MRDSDDALGYVVVFEDDLEVGATGVLSWRCVVAIGFLARFLSGEFDLGRNRLVWMIGLGYLVVVFVLRAGLLFALAVNVDKRGFRRRHVLLLRLLKVMMC